MLGGGLWCVLFLCVLGKGCLLHQLEIQLEATGSEMEKVILQEFKHSHSNPHTDNIEELFEVFRQKWIQRMVNFTLEKLSIRGEDAIEAKKHPDAYHINYQTYKILLSLESF